MNETKVTTGIVRLSYANIWEPKAGKDDVREKYSTAILIPKKDTKTIEAIKVAIEEAKQAGVAKLGGKIPNNLKVPLRDGDTDDAADGKEVYAGHYFINASSVTAPGIVDRNRKEILDREEVYSGCYCVVSLNFYAYNGEKSKGIAAGLNNIMKVKDGERLDGRTSAEEDFKDVVLDDDDDIL